MVYIVLTVVHGSEYINDVIAPYVAEELKKLLEMCGHDVTTLVNSQPRSFGDMNRPSTRDTTFRKMLDSVLTGVNKPDFLLDVHSFPSNTDSPLGGHDIVVLKSYPKFQKSLPATYYKALEKLKVDKYKIDLQNASVENDIVRQSIAHKVPAVLVEHNEMGPVGGFAQSNCAVICDLIKRKVIK